VALTLEQELSLRRKKKDPPIIGVALFELDTNCKGLKPWVPTLENSLNEGMKDQFTGVNFESPCEGAKDYCECLLAESGISEYLQHRGGAFQNYNVVVHLHYYRRRSKPDEGFHKDTRGQTLFFMLHFMNDKKIFGPEWVRDRGLLVRVSKTGVTTQRARSSPSLVDSVWPQLIREDINTLRREDEDDDDIHVLRVDPYGAVLVVDDIVHHRTPNPNPRSGWGFRKDNTRLQVSTVQAVNAEQENFVYEIPRGRKVQRESTTERGRSRSRSMSREREKAERERRERREKDVREKGDGEKEERDDSDSLARWDATFDPSPRRFFRIWITVSPKDKKVWY
jgi:hypothetical protein